MQHDDDEPHDLWSAIRARSHVIFALLGLLAWMTMLWFMFGDVL